MEKGIVFHFVRETVFCIFTAEQNNEIALQTFRSVNCFKCYLQIGKILVPDPEFRFRRFGNVLFAYDLHDFYFSPDKFVIRQ